MPRARARARVPIRARAQLRRAMRLPKDGAQANRVWTGLRAAVEGAYHPTAAVMPRPHTVSRPGNRRTADEFVVRAVPDKGGGLDVLPEVWAEMVEHSAKLASPWAMGHMDTAPHPAAALTDAVVSSLNNNLLFREISPLASVVEEQLIEEFATQLGLPHKTPGIWTSGGSLANLTALFAAAGGYSDDSPARHQVGIVMSDRSHASIKKAGRVLGVRVESVPPRDKASGCVDVDRMDDRLARMQSEGIARPVVVGTLGGTVNGHVDDIATLGEICQRRGAWLHVDAIWGAALAYSTTPTTRNFLKGLECADSVSLGPQKWLFAPRLCALTLFPKSLSAAEFDEALAAVMPYSTQRDDDTFNESNSNRGSWGLQGSRRADCLALFATLQVLGREGIGHYVDESIALTRKFHDMTLARHDTESSHGTSSKRLQVVPTHVPQLNLLNLRVNSGAPIQNVCIRDRPSDFG